MKKDFVKGIAVGCALSMAIGGASALADTYRKFLEVAYTDIKVVVNGKPTTPRDSDGTPVKPFISSGTTYLPVRSISNALGQNVDWDSDTSTIYIGDKLETDKVNMAEIEPVEGTPVQVLHFPLDKLQLFLITVLLLIVVLYLFLTANILL